MAIPTVPGLSAAQPRVNVLLFDGGGVRGLASLLILQAFMEILNNIPERRDRRGETIEPRDIFELVAGTSTGGLIAIMLGKFGMKLRECIYAYRQLSGQIFGKKSIRGRFTGGVLKPRYDGKVLRRNVVSLLDYNGLAHELPMLRQQHEQDEAIKCAVVCNEHLSEDRFEDLADDPMHFCSTGCMEQRDLHCQVCDAAQATTAAMTYFDYVEIGTRRFSDGGLRYNNPSFAIWSHYNEYDRCTETVQHFRQPSAVSVGVARHEGLHLNRQVRILNIGTGARIQSTPKPPKRQRIWDIPPLSILHSLKRLGGTLKERAINSEETGKYMALLAQEGNGKLSFHRLCPHNELCWIKLDAHKKLEDIERFTREWLDQPEIRDKMLNIASEIVREKFGWVEQSQSQPPAQAQPQVQQQPQEQRQSEEQQQLRVKFSLQEAETATGPDLRVGPSSSDDLYGPLQRVDPGRADHATAASSEALAEGHTEAPVEVPVETVAGPSTEPPTPPTAGMITAPGPSVQQGVVPPSLEMPLESSDRERTPELENSRESSHLQDQLSPLSPSPPRTPPLTEDLTNVHMVRTNSASRNGIIAALAETFRSISPGGSRSRENAEEVVIEKTTERVDGDVDIVKEKVEPDNPAEPHSGIA